MLHSCGWQRNGIDKYTRMKAVVRLPVNSKERSAHGSPLYQHVCSAKSKHSQDILSLGRRLSGGGAPCMVPDRVKGKAICWTSGNRSYPKSASRRWSTVPSCMRNLGRGPRVSLKGPFWRGQGTYRGNTSLRSASSSVYSPCTSTRTATHPKSQHGETTCAEVPRGREAHRKPILRRPD